MSKNTICPNSGKIAFPTRGHAYDFIKHQRKVHYTIYECCCGSYHITSKKTTRRQWYSKNR